MKVAAGAWTDRTAEGVPQPWQNRAPGVRDALQLEHTEASRAAPQLEQKRPVPGVEHATQMPGDDEGVVMAYNLNAVCELCSDVMSVTPR